MPKFNVQIGRNVRAYHTAIIEADDLEDLKRQIDAEGVEALSQDWEEDGQDSPEEVEIINISNPDEKVIASWSEGDGWDGEE